MLRGPKFTELSPTFKDLWGLQAFTLSSTLLERVTVDFLDSWPRLESFTCKACPHFETIDAFAEATLPRLHTLRVYGAVSCPEEDSALVQRDTLELTCYHRHLPEECDSVPQWMLEDNVEMAAGATFTGCFEPICGSLIEAFTFFDINFDSLIDTDEFRRHLYITRGALGVRTYTDSGLLCMFDKIRSASTLAPTAPLGAEIEDGITLPEFLAYTTSYSSCLAPPKNTAVIDPLHMLLL